MDAVCLGELLIDFVCPDADVSLAAATRFTRAPGGAPANVAVGLARLGHSAGFVGCVGDDPFGEFLMNTVAAEGVDVTRMVRSASARTTLAFVATRSDGRKDLTFYRHPGADAALRVEDLDPGWLAATRLFHFCSVSLSREPARSATLAAARIAREAGAWVSFDPNWRAPLWDDPGEGAHWIRAGLALADVVKVADEELDIVCGTADVDTALDRLLAGGARLAVVTLGPRGAVGATASARVAADGFPARCVDTLGAGDAFVAALLSRCLTDGLPEDRAALAAALRDANAAGALATETLGVIPALPTRAAVAARSAWNG